MIGYLALALIFGVFSAIYWGIWHGTRTKIEFEKEKLEFLENKFAYLNDFHFNDESTNSDPEMSRILDLLKQKGFKKGVIKSVDASLPHDEKKPWKVFVTAKSGTWPFNDKEKEIEILLVSNKELSENKEFLKFLESHQSIEHNK